MCGTRKHCGPCNNIGELPFSHKEEMMSEKVKMSRYNYEQGKKIACYEFPFYALIQAAMRQADSDNIEKLKKAFPEMWKELHDRYNSPGGFLDSDYIGLDSDRV